MAQGKDSGEDGDEVPGRRAAEGGEPRFRGLQEQRRNLVFGLERLGVVWRWGRGVVVSRAKALA